MADLEALSIDDLRSRRMRVRRAAEVARLRARQGGSARAEHVDRLDADLRALTDELIARYAADLTLVDSLLDPAYPAGDAPVGRATP